MKMMKTTMKMTMMTKMTQSSLAEEETHQSNAMHLHRRLRHLTRHADQIFRDLDRELKRHGAICGARGRGQVTVGDGELPDHGTQPLLGGAQIGGLTLGADERRRERVGQARLQPRQPLGRTVGARLVPEPDEYLVERAEDVHEVDEARDRDLFAGNFVQARHRDRVGEGQRVVSLERVGPVYPDQLGFVLMIRGNTYRSVTKSNQNSRRRLISSMSSPV